jgi:glycosyltransferase involved in cell wall biosynthesis
VSVVGASLRRGRVSRRPSVAFIAWTPIVGRPEEVAAALGGEARCFYSLGTPRRAAVPFRYAVDAARTLAYLARRRPHALIVANPPIFPALIGLAYARLTGARLLLDSHPSAFGLAGDEVSRRLLRLHAWAARRAATTLVSAPELAEVVGGWGARADILHEAEPAWSVPAASEAPAPVRNRVLFACIFSGDEPVGDVVEAARQVPEADVHITGDLRKCPAGLRESAPANVRFVGFLKGDDYVRALAGAGAVLALSTEPTSVMRTAHEAVWAGRPLIISRRPQLEELFPHAVQVPNDAAGIAEGIRSALARYPDLVASAPAARAHQEARWREQLDTLRSRLGAISA